MPNIVQIISDTLSNLLKNTIDFFFNLLTAAIIVSIGWVIAKIVSNVIKKVLEKSSIDKVGEKLNEIDFVKSMGTEIKLSSAIPTGLFYYIILFMLGPASEILGVSAITDMIKGIMTFIPKLLTSGLMLFVGIWLSDLLKNFVITLCKSFNIGAGKLIGTALFFFLFLIFLIQAVGQVGINTGLLESSFNLLIGGIIFAFAIGYGFASKEILLNIISSFYSKNRFKEGQILEIDGIKGEVIAMDNTTITLKTDDSKTIFPLQVLQSKKVIVFE